MGLEEELINLRLVPLGPTFQRALRAGRAAARLSDKEIDFEISWCGDPLGQGACQKRSLIRSFIWCATQWTMASKRLQNEPVPESHSVVPSALRRLTKVANAACG